MKMEMFPNKTERKVCLTSLRVPEATMQNTSGDKHVHLFLNNNRIVEYNSNK